LTISVSKCKDRRFFLVTEIVSTNSLTPKEDIVQAIMPRGLVLQISQTVQRPRHRRIFRLNNSPKTLINCPPLALSFPISFTTCTMEDRGVTHVNILRTIEAIYGLKMCGHQQDKALRFGISNDYII